MISIKWLILYLIKLQFCIALQYKDLPLAVHLSSSSSHKSYMIISENNTIMRTHPTPSIQTSSNGSFYAYRKFNVHINFTLAPYEHIAITGNDYNLGNWIPEHGVLLLNTIDNNVWTIDVKLPKNKLIEYRYFVVVLDEQKGKFEMIRYWESDVISRQLLKQIETHDTFGSYHNDINNLKKTRKQMSHGWLNGQTIVQLKFFNNPFKYNGLNDNTKIGIRIKPVVYDDQSNEIDEKYMQNIKHMPLPSDAIVEVTTMQYNNSELIIQTNDMLTVYNKNDMIIFHITLKNFDKIAYLIELMDLSEYNQQQQSLLGYQYILPNDLKGSDGELDVPIISSELSIPMGFMKLSYLIIKTMRSKRIKMNMRTSFAHYWQTNWSDLDFGHRGLGVTFKNPAKLNPNATENTIASFKIASELGVDGIEFDVHLTKDLQPVIYHDFHIYANFNSKKPKNITDLTKILIKDLTYHQLKSLRIYHVTKTNEIVEYLSHNEENRIDYRLFPLLEQLFEEINLDTGFDIEIKWPQKRQDGTIESVQTIDKNVFVDRILDVVIRKNCGRMIFMSCFDADLCTMLRYKQNLYPVMFLTNGNASIYQPYADPRSQSIKNAVANADAWELLGPIPHTEDYINDNGLTNLSNDLYQPSFCWGSDASSTEAVRHLKNIGLTGVIYDRVDKFLERNKTSSIFGGEDEKNLFKMQCIQ